MARKILTLVYDEIKHQTKMSYFVVFGNDAVWLPKNQVEIDEKTKTLEAPLWLVLEKEIEDYEY